LKPPHKNPPNPQPPKTKVTGLTTPKEKKKKKKVKNPEMAQPQTPDNENWVGAFGKEPTTTPTLQPSKKFGGGQPHPPNPPHWWGKRNKRLESTNKGP